MSEQVRKQESEWCLDKQVSLSVCLSSTSGEQTRIAFFLARVIAVLILSAVYTKSWGRGMAGAVSRDAGQASVLSLMYTSHRCVHHRAVLSLSWR